MNLVAITETLRHTPSWVWAIFAALVLLGLLHARPRRTGLQRALLMPLVIVGLSLYGTFSVFHMTPMNWVVWAGAALLSAAWFATGQWPAGTRYDREARVLHQPGSWTPLAMMMGIFAIRYAVGVMLHHHPQWAADEGMAALAASVYGALSGVFLGRTARLLRLVLGRAPEVQAPSGPVAWG